ncbi:MAG: hypothetical protein WAU82_24300 [Candidatus Binatus sp.]|uniref:hypothetical protein n=1 Tax=Candidatus Binatus sp. TaxID=2811406 RepID=UPI003BAE50BF
MKIPAYSSLASFLAHYHALKTAPSRSPDDEKLFAEMSAAISTLAPEARAALDSTEDTGSARRHRDRAELQLRRELAAHGIIAG